jgi:acyl-CoA reductase-like NAD-dependent aldehyde dehydrogenase
LQTQLIIDNQTRSGREGKTFERRNPLTGALVTTSAAAGVDDALDAVESASAAFTTWSTTGPSERRAVMLKAADIMERRGPEFIETMMSEVGAAQLWAGFNVFLTAQLFREAAGLATQIQGETLPTDKPGTLSMTVRQPAGVVLSMAPWNGAGVLAARAIAYPIVCGNTVVFRASETSPKTHAIIAEVLHEAGLPAGVLNFLTSTPEDSDRVVESIIAHPAVRRINFTGSTAVGRIIAEKAARYLKPVLLELGGKAPFVVLDDADIDGAVNAAVFGSFLYQGQICMSTERFVVDESVADEFVSKFVARAAQLGSGDPMTDEACIVGPLIREESGARINGLIDDALAKGAELVVGDRANGASMPATIIDKVRPEMSIYDQETFGANHDGCPRFRCRRGGSGGKRYRVRSRSCRFRGRQHPGIADCHANSGRARACQRGNRAERGAGSLRRHEKQWLRPVRWPGRNQRVHGAEVDHRGAVRPAVPVLNQRPYASAKERHDYAGNRSGGPGATGTPHD